MITAISFTILWLLVNWASLRAPGPKSSDQLSFLSYVLCAVTALAWIHALTGQ